jgi:hypothetical protein
MDRKGEPGPILRTLGVLALLAAALGLRYLFVFELNPPSDNVFSDMAGFVRRAQNILDGRFVRADTLFAPGEHLLLAASGRLLDGFDTLALWVHVIAGVATCYWVSKAAEHHLGKSEALATLVLCVLHFPFIALSGYYLAETVFTALLALLFLLMSRAPFPWSPGLALSIGAVAALGLLWKGTNVLFLPILGLWTIGWSVRAGTGSARQAWRCWSRLLLGFFLVLGGQALYFFQLYNVPLPIAAGGGYNFAMNKCPGARIVGKDGMQFQSPTTYYTGEGGVQVWDVYLYDQSYLWKAGLECVRRNPWVAVSSLREISYLFRGNQLWPVNTGSFEDFSARYERRFAILLFPGIVLALLVLARDPFSARTAPFLLSASVGATAWLFMGEMRFRIPFDVVFIPMGVLGWNWGLSTLLGKRAARHVAHGFMLVYLLALGLPVVGQFL